MGAGALVGRGVRHPRRAGPARRDDDVGVVVGQRADAEARVALAQHDADAERA